MDENPAFDCLTQGHFNMIWVDSRGKRGSSCLWCPTAVYDPEMDTDKAEPTELRLKQDW